MPCIISPSFCFLIIYRFRILQVRTAQEYDLSSTTTIPIPNIKSSKSFSTTNIKTYAKALVLSLFISLGIALPVFPVARPYIPSSLGALGPIARVVTEAKNEVLTAPIPKKWMHTHGFSKSEEPEAKKRSIVGDCPEGVACAGLIKDVIHKMDEVFEKAKEEIGKELDEAKNQIDEELGDSYQPKVESRLVVEW
ncbi:hypothetical protein AA0120_g2013 [Alternaria tenuissima]|nr:hypothetical protein AA0120_g2013 [Alternaria tenuissima]